MLTRIYQTDGCIPGCFDWSNQKPKPALSDLLLGRYEIIGSTKLTGLLCLPCQNHSIQQRNGIGTWTYKPCTYLCKDVLESHKKSAMHIEALEWETLW